MIFIRLNFLSKYIYNSNIKNRKKKYLQIKIKIPCSIKKTKYVRIKLINIANISFINFIPENWKVNKYFEQDQQMNISQIKNYNVNN